MIQRLRYWLSRAKGLAARTDALEHQAAFLITENIRLNQLVRELIYGNDLKRPLSGQATLDSFRFQWAHLPTGAAMPSNRAFLEDAPAQLQKMADAPAEWFRGKRVLDIGCGIGRWSHALLTMGAHVTSFDQSPEAIAATARLCSSFPHHVTMQGNLLNADDLPAARFDFVWCFGVCHHTVDVWKAVAHVLQSVQAGGCAFLMLYGYPTTPSDCRSHATFEEWRQRLAPLSFDERTNAIRQAFPAEDLHGYFDALSPPINDLLTWEAIQTFVQDRGFTDVRRTITHGNHHFVATKT